MKKFSHPRKEDLDLCSILYALSDPVRLSIVRDIMQKGECACSSFKVSLAKSTMSHHFKVLRDSGIIMTRVKGTEYGLTVRKDDIEDRFPGLLKSVVKASCSSESACKAKK